MRHRLQPFSRDPERDARMRPCMRHAWVRRTHVRMCHVRIAAEARVTSEQFYRYCMGQAIFNEKFAFYQQVLQIRNSGNEASAQGFTYDIERVTYFKFF